MSAATPWQKFNGHVKLSLTIKPESSVRDCADPMSHSRAPTLTHPTPLSAADLTPLSREQAVAAFDREDAPEEWLKDRARLPPPLPPAPGFRAGVAHRDPWRRRARAR